MFVNMFQSLGAVLVATRLQKRRSGMLFIDGFLSWLGLYVLFA